MSLEKIVTEAIEGRPLGLKEAFEEEMEKRIIAALEEKASEALAEEEEIEDAIMEADEEDEDEEEEDEDDDEDEDEDDD